MTAVEGVAKWVTILATAGGLCWSVASALQSHAIDARRPFLDLQIKLYQEATKIASVLATSNDTKELQAAEERFWQLYWGELGLVENGGIKSEDGGVEGAMVRFGDEFQKRPSDRNQSARLALG